MGWSLRKARGQVTGQLLLVTALALLGLAAEVADAEAFATPDGKLKKK